MMRFLKKGKPKRQTDEKNKPYAVSFGTVEPIAQYFQDITGITFEQQTNILKNKLTLFSKQKNIYSFEELLQQVQGNTVLQQELIDYLTTNETYFYREFKQIQKLVQLVKNTTSPVKILCAPCATGEEVYSIVIALLEADIALTQFHVTGIDINAQVLEKAKTATYKAKNLRNLSSEVINKYFIFDGETYTLRATFTAATAFKLINIFDSDFHNLGKFDFVFSRNMLIYFDKATKSRARKILEDMRKSTQYPVFFGHADLF